MKTTYLECHHGILLLHGCQKCEDEKRNLMQQFLSAPKEEDKHIPIYRGCTNGTCFCTGRCKEVIGYREPE